MGLLKVVIQFVSSPQHSVTSDNQGPSHLFKASSSSCNSQQLSKLALLGKSLSLFLPLLLLGI